MSNGPIPVSLSENDHAALESIAGFHEVGKPEIIKRAIRLYLMVDARVRGGDQMAFVDSGGTIVKQEIRF